MGTTTGCCGSTATFRSRSSSRSGTWCRPDSRRAFGHVFVTEIGPIPHLPEDGKVVAVRPGREPRQVASGASMLIDVERGPHGKLLRDSRQGQWDGVGEGSRADPDTGRLLVVGRHGNLTPVVDRRGRELVLDRPVSVEFVGATAYVLSVTGDVYRVDGL